MLKKCSLLHEIIGRENTNHGNVLHGHIDKIFTALSYKLNRENNPDESEKKDCLNQYKKLYKKEIMLK